jgi:ABC-type amino acid transport substrate-binding protein
MNRFCRLGDLEPDPKPTRLLINIDGHGPLSTSQRPLSLHGGNRSSCPSTDLRWRSTSERRSLWHVAGDTLDNILIAAAQLDDITKKHMLDVDIACGSGSVAAAQAIGEARFDFGIASPSSAMPQVVKGLPTAALAACAYDATMGIGVLADGRFKTPKDLEGRKLASTMTSGEYPLPVFAEKIGVNLAKVTRIQVEKVRDRFLPEGKVDAISG